MRRVVLGILAIVLLVTFIGLAFVFVLNQGHEVTAAPTSTPQAIDPDLRIAVAQAAGSSFRAAQLIDNHIDLRLALPAKISPAASHRAALDDIAAAGEVVATTGYDLRVEVVAPLVDKYGNSETGTVLTVWLESDELAKVNWANFNPANLRRIADFYLVHPLLNSEYAP